MEIEDGRKIRKRRPKIKNTGVKARTESDGVKHIEK